MDIAEAHAQILPEIHERYLTVAEGRAGLSEISPTLEELSHLFEALALCHLLESADTTEFVANLSRSGQVRRYFLTRCQQQNLTSDRRLALSRTSAFLASVAAGHLPLARDIAARSPSRHNPNWEYGEDYAFFYFLHGLVLDPAAFPRPFHTTILDRFEQFLDGVDSARLPVCRALVNRDAPAFVSALKGRMSEEQEQVEVERTSAAVLEGDPTFWPRSFVSIEGLAFLKIAEWIGLPFSGEFPRCPPLARVPTITSSAERDFFGELLGS
ncbi:MAG: immunity 49 family protein [Polyangiaceae bacterium]|nr:immunity 49 family protein [Polyangiaceae bacterium]